ncbi:CCCH zinc finger protein [Aspergillus sclerotialis]|uniref:CCCH zinc finger protein n=1 Tax=Aspergillus sclerotialis TaxID=2070753 RepID=A0A3A2ZSX9_9EURO|nr:CCCH zinc finger protein [Aspergillus sclerotialis]
MTPQGFSFPPPPPPPPQNQQQSTYPPASQYGQNYGQRGGRGGYQRGRGRGFGNRGCSRGGHFTASDASHSHPYSANAPSVNYAQMNYGYAAQPLPTHTPGSIPPSQYGQTASQYSQVQSQNFPPPPNPSAFTSQPFSQPAAPHMPPSPYQHQTSYETAYNQPMNTQHLTTSYSSQTASLYPSTMPPHQQASQPNHPAMMGPPMRWGFESSGTMGSFAGNQHGTTWGPWPFNPHGNQTQTNKRDYGSAFGKPRSVGPRVPAPPPVPSFGNPLPSKPPPPADAARKPKKKKRKHNQLGLTPKAEEHESSEEEDDMDEESKLAAGSGGAGMALKFTYRGKTSTLQSPADIAKWIEERKNRFPTQARIEEKKKAMEEAKKAREEAAKQKELQKQQSKRQQKEDQKASQNKPPDPADTAAKAKKKAKRLRKKLLKEEKRLRQAEAEAEALRNGSTDNTKEVATDQITSNPNSNGQQGVIQPQASPGLDVEAKQNDLHPTMNGVSNAVDSTVALPTSEEPSKQGPDDGMHVDSDSAIQSSDPESSDWTSSSGSDLSSSDSEESEDDSAPEELTSRREGPERVAPPPRDRKKTICRHFARTGRCLRGEKCRFLHEIPEKGPKSKPAEKKGRKGLLQALLDRQREDEDRRVMEAIMVLGEQGALEPTAENE